MKPAKASCTVEKEGPGVVVVYAGTTNVSVARAASTASAGLVPSTRYSSTRWRSAPTTRHSPRMPVHAIITAEYTASRATIAAVGATGKHHRDDQSHLDHGDGDSQDQRPVGLTHSERHHFGVMHRRQHRDDQRHRYDDDQHPGRRPTPHGRENQHGGDRCADTPARKCVRKFRGHRFISLEM